MGVINRYQARNQYPLHLTFKRTVLFSDFQPQTSNEATFEIFHLPMNSVPIYLQITPVDRFEGVQVTMALLKITTTLDGVVNLSNNFIFGSFDLRTLPGLNEGIQTPIPKRVSGFSPNAIPTQLAKVQDSPILLNLLLNNNASINDLSSGEFNMWFTHFKNI